MSFLALLFACGLALAESDSEIMDKIGDAIRKQDHVLLGILARRYIQQNPSDSYGYSLLGSALTQQKDFAGAEEAYIKAISLDPEDLSLVFKRGQSRLEGRNYSGAHDDFVSFIDRAGKRSSEEKEKQRLLLPRDGIVESFLYKADKLKKFDSPANKTLLTAARKAISELARMSLSKGASPNAISFDGEEAIYIAADKGHADIVRLLLEKGADPESEKDQRFWPYSYDRLKGVNSSWNALTIAVGRGHLETVKALVEAGASLEKPKNLPPIMRVAFDGRRRDFDIFKYLLDKGANPNFRNSAGVTPLMMLMLDYHDRNDFNDKTIAVFSKELIRHGANVNLKANNGKTAIDYAMEGGHTETLKVLLEHAKP
jgi:ankyrin repeat protein